MRSRRRPRGFSLVEVMFSIVIATVVLGIAVGVITQFNGTFVRHIAGTQGVERVQNLEEILRTAAASSRLLFTPEHCGLGHCAGSDSPTCSKVRFTPMVASLFPTTL